jgi:hypothetical protein
VDVTADELRLYLNLGEVDAMRAEFLLDQALTLAASIVTPVPDAAKPIILAAAGRAYANPQGVSQETVGPYGVQRPFAGLFFTRAEQAALRRLGGQGGAFTVDTTPATADPLVTWPYDPDNPFGPTAADSFWGEQL